MMRAAQAVRPLLRISFAAAFAAAAWLLVRGSPLPARVLIGLQPLNLLVALRAGPESIHLAAFGLIILTAVFGRLWCGFACPLGAAQDAFAALKNLLRRGRARAPRRVALGRGPQYVRYGVLAFLLLLLALGFNVVGLLEPNTMTLRAALAAASRLSPPEGRAPPVPLPPLVVFAAVAALALVRPRLFCRYVCPSGAVLSLLSLRAPFRVRVAENCRNCGACSAVCPTAAIGTGGTVSQDACVVCLRCVAACGPGALRYGPGASGRMVSPVTVKERRRFVLVVAAAAAAAVLGRLFLPRSAVEKLRPPGAIDDFAAACNRCMACVAVCPNDFVRPGAFLLPTLDSPRSYCEYRCLECGRVCPTGAIRFGTVAEKWRRPQALAVIDRSRCYVYSGVGPCMGCQEVCPAEPENAVVGVELERGGETMEAPRIAADRCVGCGTCATNCPAGAIRLVPR